jgi:hypothetical protein
MVTKRKYQINFVTLHDHIGLNTAKERGYTLIVDAPTKLDAILMVTQIVPVLIEMPAKLIEEHLDDWVMCHANTNGRIIPNVLASCLFEDASKAFTVKQASDIAIIHNITQGFDRMVANSEKTRCPARKGAEGQPRAKQVIISSPGVCNEHGLPPEGKMCSGLHRNMQRLAEMTNPAFFKPVTNAKHKVHSLEAPLEKEHGTLGS